ncbi:MAG TPA: hypothetical protein C5S37_05285 [Methanophagales archaeon]|nr:hypothetical protein [Methanophagales archaeon]
MKKRKKLAVRLSKGEGGDNKKKKAEDTDAEENESVFHKKLKIKLKEKGKEGRLILLEDYLDYFIRGNKTLPPDFPTFVREIMGLDEREGFLHIRIWHENSELVDFATTRGYEYKIDTYD